MRRDRLLAWIGLILVIPAVWLVLPSLLGSGSVSNPYRGSLGLSLLILGMTFTLRTMWPKPGQVDVASLVFMAVAVLPSWLVASGARWGIKWRLVAHIAWGTLLFLALAAVTVALFGDSLDAIILGTVVMMLNLCGNLIVMIARLPVSRQQ